MAIQIIENGPFVKEPGQLPGLYVRFVEAAIAAIGIGARSKVGTLKFISDTPTGTAEAGKVYRLNSTTAIKEAKALFGEDYKDIEMYVRGGASEIVVVTMETPVDPAEAGYETVLGLIEPYDFHVFCLAPGASSALRTAVKLWEDTNYANGRAFITVYADKTLEGNAEGIISAMETFKGDNSTFVSGGVYEPDGTEVDAELYACYIAGKIAGTQISGSLTYFEPPFAEPITRYRIIDRKKLIAAGAIVSTMFGDTLKIEQGLTLGDAPFNKIRTVRAKQQLISDISEAVNDNYVGKITNNEDGQIAVLNAVKVYLETLANANVIDSKFSVELDPEFKSTGDEIYIKLGVKFLDSIEYVYLTVSVEE